MPKVTLFEARWNQCRTPLWESTKATPLNRMFVCGAETLPERSYCAECRKALISSVMTKSGRVVPREIADERRARRKRTKP